MVKSPHVGGYHLPVAFGYHNLLNAIFGLPLILPFDQASNARQTFMLRLGTTSQVSEYFRLLAKVKPLYID